MNNFKQNSRVNMWNTAIWLLIVICIGCAAVSPNSATNVTPQALWDAPLPTPVLLGGITAMTNEAGTSLGTCVKFNRFELGTRTDLPDETPEILYHTLIVHVDGIKINNPVDASLGWFDHTLCFDHSYIDYGLHVADFAFRTTSGADNRYTWAFRISAGVDGKPVIAYPPALQS